MYDNIKNDTHALKNMVLELNEFLKKHDQIVQQKEHVTIDDFLKKSPCKNLARACEGFSLSFRKNSAPYQNDCPCSFLKKNFSDIFSKSLIQKIKAHWPLKKGSVDTKTLAWETTDSAYETVQSSIAFLIKCASVSNMDPAVKPRGDMVAPRGDIETARQGSVIPRPDRGIHDDTSVLNYFNFLFTMRNIFFNPKIQYIFWSEIKNDLLLKKQITQGETVVLCLEETCFRLRSGSNMELSAFEQFIDNLSRNDNSLIVFSTQNLLSQHKKNSGIQKSYSINFKQDHNMQNYSIEQAMEPDFHISSDERFLNAQRTGGYDRLLELLTKGQDFINRIEKDFLQWKIKTES